MGSCPQNCGDRGCEGSYSPGAGLLVRIRLQAGPSFLPSRGHLASVINCDLLSGMKSASSSSQHLPFVGVLVLQKSSKILLRVSLAGEPGPCHKAALLAFF